MTLETWFFFLAVSLAPVISPGPGVLLAITNSLRYGARVTILIGLVNGAGIAALGIMVGFGLGAVMQVSELAFLFLKAAGAIYLIWLGVKIWRDRTAFLIETETQEGPVPWTKLGTQALTISLTNPKAMIAIAALFPPFLNAEAPAAGQVMILALSYGGLCALNHMVIAFSGSWLRKFLKSPKRAQHIRRLTGGMFVGFGSLLAISTRH